MLANPHCISERVFNADFFFAKIGSKNASKYRSKMSKKDQESPLVLVYSILQEHAGQFLSAREILSAVYEKHQTSMHIDTVKGALSDLLLVQGQIVMELHRVEPKRIPTAVFKLPKS